MEDYFGYEMFVVMNVTDVDDKIILKARRTYLIQQYSQENKFFTDAVKMDLLTAWTKESEGLKKKIGDVENDKK